MKKPKLVKGIDGQWWEETPTGWVAVNVTPSIGSPDDLSIGADGHLWARTATAWVPAKIKSAYEVK